MSQTSKIILEVGQIWRPKDVRVKEREVRDIGRNELMITYRTDHGGKVHVNDCMYWTMQKWIIRWEATRVA